MESCLIRFRKKVSPRAENSVYCTCRTKVKKLQQDYKKIKDKHNLTGRGRTTWKFYEPFNEILGTWPATHPSVVLDTLDPPSLLPEGSAEITDEQEPDESEGGAVPSEEITVLDNSNVEVNEPRHGSENKPKTSVISTGIKGKKRKRSKGEVMEGVALKVMKSVTDGLRESDKLFLEIEKRLKFEEQKRRK